MIKKFTGTHEEYVEMQKSYIDKTVGRDGKPCIDKVTFANMRAPGDYLTFKSRFWRYRKCINSERKAVMLGARLGTEVVAMRDLGHQNCIGMDLQTKYANDETLVEYGDFMNLKYEDNSIQFVYSNCLDHLYDPKAFIDGLERVMEKDGYAILDVNDEHISKQGFAGWDMYQPENLSELLNLLQNENRQIVFLERNSQPFPGGGISVLLKFGKINPEQDRGIIQTIKSHDQEKNLFEAANNQRLQLKFNVNLLDK
jgi:hypothetical protein